MQLLTKTNLEMSIPQSNMDGASDSALESAQIFTQTNKNQTEKKLKMQSSKCGFKMFSFEIPF